MIGLIVTVIGFIPRCCIPSGTSVTKRSRVGNVGFVRDVNTRLNGEGNPFGLALRSVTNVMVFDTVIIRLESGIGLIVIVLFLGDAYRVVPPLETTMGPI